MKYCSLLLFSFALLVTADHQQQLRRQLPKGGKGSVTSTAEPVPCDQTTLGSPCGTHNGEDHACTYFPADGDYGKYECECDGHKCSEYGTSESVLCTAEGFTLGALRNWYWVCECPDESCGNDVILSVP